MKKKGKKQGTTRHQPPLISTGKRFLSLLPGIIVFAVPFLLYAVTISYGFILDDPGVLALNRFVNEGIAGIPDILTNSYRAGVNIYGDNIYRPVSQIMFALEWEVSPFNPHLHHLVNVLFYSLSCLLLWIFLKKLLVHVHEIVILAIVLLFAVHPIHTEVVAYVKCRDEIMSLFFLLITLVFIHKWLTTSVIINIVISAAAFFLALMSKEGVVTMLAIFPVMAWFFTRAGWRKMLTATAIMTIPAAFYILIRHAVLASTPPIWGLAPVDNFLVLAPDWGSRVATAVMILGKYLWLLIFPHPLISDYSYAQFPMVGFGNPWFLLSVAAWISLIIIILLRFRKKEPWVFGLIFLLISISIYSNLFFLIGTIFGERLMFIPSLGFCIALICFLKWILPASNIEILSFSQSSFFAHRYLILFVGSIITIYTVKSVDRILDWKTDNTLVSQDVKTNPRSARLQLHVGNMHRDRARFSEDPELKKEYTRKSLAAYREALRILPSWDDAQEQAGLAWYLLGYHDMGAFYFKMALKKNPMRADSWNNLGNIYVDKGDLPAALDAFLKAISVNQWFTDAYRNAGSVLGKMGKYEEAVPFFMKCIESDSNDVRSCQYLGLTFQNMGRQADAKYWFDRADRIK